jgi:BAI1-associated protein 3
LKGLDRYFKQIAQSARTDRADKDSHVDDFLGSVNISLEDLPSSGLEKWYDLEGRTEKSRVEGKIRLRLKLSTREDRGQAEEDNWNDLKQQENILAIFINHELNRLNEKKNNEWSGELSREAETILHQHAIQGDISDFQITMW